MIHTDAHRATLKNTLSREEEESITLCQGHSRETAKRFYELNDHKQAAVHTIAAHKVLYGEMPAIKISKRKAEDEDFKPIEEEFEDSPSKRIKWTPEHEQWIVKWIEEYKRHVLYNGKINWKKCSKDISNDLEAMEIFTPAHTDPSKLREFAKRLNRKNSKI